MGVLAVCKLARDSVAAYRIRLSITSAIIRSAPSPDRQAWARVGKLILNLGSVGGVLSDRLFGRGRRLWEDRPGGYPGSSPPPERMN